VKSVGRTTSSHNLLAWPGAGRTKRPDLSTASDYLLRTSEWYAFSGISGASRRWAATRAATEFKGGGQKGAPVPRVRQDEGSGTQGLGAPKLPANL
jgi:hypothetical protein